LSVHGACPEIEYRLKRILPIAAGEAASVDFAWNGASGPRALERRLAGKRVRFRGVRSLERAIAWLLWNYYDLATCHRKEGAKRCFVDVLRNQSHAAIGKRGNEASHGPAA